MNARDRLLIADDHQAMRWLVKAMVGNQFDEVIETADGRDLMWRLLRWSYEPDAGRLVVIADVCMPVYNGLDVLEACRELGIPTIVITSYPTAEVCARAEQLGVSLVAKPFTAGQLAQAVTHALEA